MDYWKILGLSEGATLVEIKTAYRTLAKQYHPDHNNSPDAVKKFREVHEAYEVLSENPHYNSSVSSNQDYDFYYYSHETSSFEGGKYEYNYDDDDDFYDDDFEDDDFDDDFDEYEDEDEYYDATDSYYNHIHQTRNNKEQNTPPDYSLTLKDKIYMAIAIIFGLPILLIVCFFMVMLA